MAKDTWSVKVGPETKERMQELVQDFPDQEAALIALMDAYVKQGERQQDPERAKEIAKAEGYASALVTMVAQAYDSRAAEITVLKETYEGEGGKLTAAERLNKRLQQQLEAAEAAQAAAEAERDKAITERDKAIAERDAAIMAKNAAEAHAQDMDDLRQMLTMLTSSSASESK